MTHALALGINVIQLTSTAIAKAWIEANRGMLCTPSLLDFPRIHGKLDFLKQHNGPSWVRVISDNHRNESTNPFLNLAAGENILRYLRGRQFNFPVMIYAGYSVQYTQYVSQYEMAGSTYMIHICLEFINNLAMGRSEDVDKLEFLMEGELGLIADGRSV